METQYLPTQIRLTTYEVFDLIVRRGKVRFILLNKKNHILIATLSRHFDHKHGYADLDIDIKSEYIGPSEDKEKHVYAVDFPGWWYFCESIAKSRIINIL